MACHSSYDVPVNAIWEPCRRYHVHQASLYHSRASSGQQDHLEYRSNRRSRKRLGVECMPQFLDFMVTQDPVFWCLLRPTVYVGQRIDSDVLASGLLCPTKQGVQN